jgi:hypothetical protein
VPVPVVDLSDGIGGIKAADGVCLRNTADGLAVATCISYDFSGCAMFHI